MLTLTGFGLGCLASLFMISWRDLRQLLVGKLFLLIVLAASAYLIDPLMPVSWRWVTSDLQTSLPLLFWLLCQLVFAPRPRLVSVWGGHGALQLSGARLFPTLYRGRCLARLGYLPGLESRAMV
ncbi:hypothetical protein [Marinobacter sp. VGCF2001]|uniref:hypothetical protein n=1 Tax=Marinobacter sp. VGCF2001 TaxID=3417189 RepID=UPI003CF2E5BA